MVMLPRVYRLAAIKALPAKLLDALQGSQQGCQYGPQKQTLNPVSMDPEACPLAVSYCKKM